MKTRTSGAGYYCYSGPDVPGGRFEADFFACAHCQCGMTKPAWESAGGLCFVCDEQICTNCLGRIAQHGCEGMKRKLDKAANDLYRRQQNARILGI